MKKNILIGAAVIGSLVLAASLLAKDPTDTTPVVSETPAESTLQPVSGIPLYPNAKIVKSTESAGEGNRTFYSITLSTTDSISEINDWYRSALSSGGWSIKSDKNIAGYQLIQGETETMSTSMQAAGGEDGTVTISQQARKNN